MSDGILITGIDITPVAFKDPALLNAVGVHEPYALRAIVEVHTDQGLAGLGETYADEGHLRRLRTAADTIVGMDVHALGAIRRRIALALGDDSGSDGHGLTGMITTSSTVDRVFSPSRSPAWTSRAMRPDAQSATCSAVPSANRSPSAPTFSTSGPAIPAPSPTTGAPRSTPTASSPKPGA